MGTGERFARARRTLHRDDRRVQVVNPTAHLVDPRDEYPVDRPLAGCEAGEVPAQQRMPDVRRVARQKSIGEHHECVELGAFVEPHVVRERRRNHAGILCVAIPDEPDLAGVAVDLDTQELFLNIEAERRIGDKLSLEFQLRSFMNAKPSGSLFAVKQDDYLQLRLNWYY